MPTPLPQVFAEVPTLNDPAEPYSFAVVGNTITGRWDIVHAKFLDLNGAGTIDKDYVIVVDFNEEKGTFDFEETKEEAASDITVDDGKISFGGEKKFFKGKSIGKEFHFEAGGIYNKANEGNSLALTYEFETKRIKEPLFTFLERHGWKRKKGLFGGLFDR
jgi:hypothetical protein